MKVMKNLLRIIFICVIMLCPFVVGCKDNNNSNQSPPVQINTILPINISYFDKLFIDTDKAAFGIMKTSISTTKTVLAAKDSGLNSQNLADKDEMNNLTEKYYLYYADEYSNDESFKHTADKVNKATFKKNKHHNKPVYDYNGNEIDEERVINQDEMPVQINKLYVTDKFMFMQFVVMVEKSGYYNYYDDEGAVLCEYVDIRPSSLVYLENGTCEYDMGNYKSGALSQSFVVDLSNGYIYKISDFNISKIHDTDIVIGEGGKYYKLSISADNELIFIDVMPNKSVRVEQIVTDKYGYTFVYNSEINQVDHTNKIHYIKYDYSNAIDYYYYGEYREMYYTTSITPRVTDLKVFVNGFLQSVSNDYTTGRLYSMRSDMRLRPGFYKGYQMICGATDAQFSRWTLLWGKILLTGDLGEYSKVNYRWFNDNAATGLLMIELENNWHYVYIDVDEYLELSGEVVLNLEDINVVKITDKQIKNCGAFYLKMGDDTCKIESEVYVETTLTGTNYYQIVQNGKTLELKLLENKAYTQDSFVFQPINK